MGYPSIFRTCLWAFGIVWILVWSFLSAVADVNKTIAGKGKAGSIIGSGFFPK